MMNKLFTLTFFVLSFSCIHGQLPHEIIKDLSGRDVCTDTIQNGGCPIIISFFATWCKPCIRELNAINENYEDWHSETGVRVIAVSIDEAQNAHKVKPFIDSYGWDFDVLLDSKSDFCRAMNVHSIPHVFIIAGNGKIIYSRNGYSEGSEFLLFDKLHEITLGHSKKR